MRTPSHSVSGLGVCDAGIVIDLRGRDGIDVDPEAKRARVGGGVLWGALDDATQAHGLHVPGGRVTTTGVGGFTTGGGYGWLSSKHGLACDSLRAVQIVTADGRAHDVSAHSRASLF